MRLINLLSGFMPFGPCVLGLGTFDGLHIGHQTLINSIIQKAREKHLPSVIFTFDHSPKRILHPDSFLGEITTPEEKFGLLLATGVDWVVFRPFDTAFADTSPRAFIEKIVVNQLQSTSVFVGFNFGFGLRREGNAEILGKELERFGVECKVISPVQLDGKTISSTAIRQSIKDGEIELANHLLGRAPAFSGIVIHGDHRGRKMGFPTANLDLEGTSKVIPPRGVYYCLVDTPQGVFPSIVNIGIRPTFDKTQSLLEAHLIDFHDDIYHQTIRIRFLKRLRGEVRFPTMDALITQIKEDMLQSRLLMKTLSSKKQGA